MRKLFRTVLISSTMTISVAHAEPIQIVAAENFYGDIAEQIAGPDAKVTSILGNPAQDPHLFEVSPSVARSVAAAQVVIYNGIGYDPWIETLLQAARSANRKTIVVAELVGKRTGDNPHIWYNPAAMQALAKSLCEALISNDPGHKVAYEERMARFEDSLKPVQAMIVELRRRLAGTFVTATEPVFGDMFDALGMQVRNQSFQLAVMNNTEPGASDVAAFENDLRTHQVKLLVYNSQVTGPITDRMETIAKASGVPVIGVTETEPRGEHYQGWMMSELAAVDRALPRGSP